MFNEEEKAADGETFIGQVGINQSLHKASSKSAQGDTRAFEPRCHS